MTPNKLPPLPEPETGFVWSFLFTDDENRLFLFHCMDERDVYQHVAGWMFHDPDAALADPEHCAEISGVVRTLILEGEFYPEGDKPAFLRQQSAEALRQSQSLPAGAVAGLAETIVRDACETDPADPDAPDTICIPANRLQQIVEQALQADAREKGEAWDGELFERAYVKGYRAALGAASSECRRIGEALDHAGNPYVRYADAIKCSVSISALRPPEIANDLDKPVAWRAEFSDGWTEYADENGDGPDEWKGWANPPDRIIPLYSHALATQPAQASEKDFVDIDVCAMVSVMAAIEGRLKSDQGIPREQAHITRKEFNCLSRYMERYEHDTHPQPVTPEGGEVEPLGWIGDFGLNMMSQGGNSKGYTSLYAKRSRSSKHAVYLHPPVADAALLKDGERFRWLLSGGKSKHELLAFVLEHKDPRDAIDAALNQRGGGDHG